MDAVELGSWALVDKEAECCAAVVDVRTHAAMSLGVVWKRVDDELEGGVVASSNEAAAVDGKYLKDRTWLAALDDVEDPTNI